MALSLSYQNSLLRTLLHSFSDGGVQYEGKEVYSWRLNLGVWSIGVANYGGTKLSQGGKMPPLPPPGKKPLASPEEQCRRAGHFYTPSAAAVVAVG